MTTLVLPYPPSANHYKVPTRKPGVWRLTEEAQAFKQECRLRALTQVGADMPLAGAVAVTVRFYRPRKAGDLDNLQKVALDALNGIAWKDDKQIVEIHAYRHDDKSNPRMEIEVTECRN